MSQPGDALRLAHCGVAGADGRSLTRQTLRKHADEIAADSSIVTLAVGKAASAMTAGLHDVLGERVRCSLVIEPPTGGLPTTPRTTHVVGDHPLPGNNSLVAGTRLAAFLQDCSDRGLHRLIVALSGGTSSLVAMPAEPMELDRLHDLGHRLLMSGMDVTKINEVRLATSLIHGGCWLTLIPNAEVHVLTLSDNIQVGYPAVGSWFAVPRCPESRQVHQIVSSIGESADAARTVLAAAHNRSIVMGAPRALVGTHVSVGGPETALTAVVHKASELGYEVVSLGSGLSGTTDNVAMALEAVLRSNSNRPFCVVGAGEPTAAVGSSGGRGGRCQDVALRLLASAADISFEFASIATDGRDYIPGVMGASYSTDRVRALFSRSEIQTNIAEFNAYSPLESMGALVPSRATGTNVCDLFVGVVR